MTKKILAILMALMLVLSFAACGAKDDDTTTESTTDAFDSFGEDETDATEATDATDATDASTDETTVAEADSTEATSAKADESTTAKKDETSKTETTTKAAKAPSSKAEIIEYYNKAINNVKPKSKSITIESVVNQPAGSVEGLPKTLSSIADSVISSNTGEDKDAKGKVLSSAADKKASFPVENESWSSKLSESDVKSATLKESGGKYKITITTVADAKSETITHGTGHAPKAFSVIMPAIINENVPSSVKKLFSVGNASLNYPESTVTVIVDAKTGNVENAKYDLFWTMNIPLGDSTVVIPFETISTYTIAW